MENAESLRGDGPFPVRNLDPGWPRRVMFLSPAKGLAGFRDLTGDEGAAVTVRLDRCASITGRVVDRAGMPIAGVNLSLVYDDSKNQPHIGFPNGKWVPTPEEMMRDQRLHPDAETHRAFNIVTKSSKDGRFRDPKCRSRGEMPPSGRCDKCSPSRNEGPSWGGEKAGLRSGACGR